MTRTNRAREDASVEVIQDKIEAVFGLPSGSVRIVKPDGRKKRADASIASLREEWA